jgi:hypothetical protein
VTVTLDARPSSGVVADLSHHTFWVGVEESQVGSYSGRTLGVTSPFLLHLKVGAIWVLASSQVETQLFGWCKLLKANQVFMKSRPLLTIQANTLRLNRAWHCSLRDITVLSTTPGTPTGLKVSESLYRVKDQALC